MPSLTCYGYIWALFLGRKMFNIATSDVRQWHTGVEPNGNLSLNTSSLSLYCCTYWRQLNQRKFPKHTSLMLACTLYLNRKMTTNVCVFNIYARSEPRHPINRNISHVSMNTEFWGGSLNYFEIISVNC